MNISDHAYQGNSVYLQVNLAGQDVSDDIGGVSGLSKSLDYPRLTEYRVGEATLTLNDSNGYYSPRNDANFFVENGTAQTGQGVACTIVTGFYTESGVVSETLFTGEITQVEQSAAGITTVVVSDAMHTLFTEDITDFGVDRQFRLYAEDGRDIHGNYPIAAFVGPPSRGSVTVKKDVNTELTEVVALAESGTFDSDNYIVTDTAVKSEGGTIEGAATGYPQIEMKSPYKHRFLKDVVASVATHLGLTTQDIYVPGFTLGDNFSTEGRFGYELIATTTVGSSVRAEWGRYVTDYLYDNGDYYFLFNAHRGDLQTSSLLVKYTESTYTTSILYESAVPSLTHSGTEFWRLAKNGDTIAILATDSNVQASTEGIPIGTRTIVSGESADDPITITFFGKGRLTITASSALVLPATSSVTGVSPDGSRISEDITIQDGETTASGTLIFDGRSITITPNAMRFDGRTLTISAEIFRDVIPDYAGFVPTETSYDASVSGSQTFITFYDESTDTAAVRVPKAGPLKAQLACYYILGETEVSDNDARREGLPSMLPDTRRGFAWYNNELYYCYVNASNGQFGVAKVGATGNPSALFAMASDGTNHAGLNFTLDGGFIWVGVPRSEGNNSSKFTVFNQAL